jgi:hypothetical protein
MRKDFALVFAALALLPVPALAGGGGPSVGSLWGIIIIIIALIIGFIIGWLLKKK